MSRHSELLGRSWTAETVDLVVRVGNDHNAFSVDEEARTWTCRCGYTEPLDGDYDEDAEGPFDPCRRHSTAAVLAALHEAGRLVPAANGETADCGCPVEYHAMRRIWLSTTATSDGRRAPMNRLWWLRRHIGHLLARVLPYYPKLVWDGGCPWCDAEGR